MKRILLLLIIPILLCGCEAEYKLTIKGNSVSEKLDIRENQSNINTYINDMSYKDLFDKNLNVKTQALIREPEFLDEDDTVNPNAKFYNKNIIDDSNYYGISLNYDFTYSDFKDSYIINSCVNNVNFLKNDSNIIINTKSISYCFDKFNYLDKITVIINIKNKVISSNATSVDGNIYKWEINRGYNEIIFIEYKSNLLTTEENPIEEKQSSNFWKENWLGLFIALIILSVAVLFTFSLVMKKNKANNKL